ncbi:hypothetical protein HOD05_02105 [Candidatus Woesearchaeota archaeon]|jgi:hypothetical protein|nr:hypothetical protein [Candidatus Woesearchaeota archaeon]MBT4151252.1 hypothetical protein [Candidatus Woesearchaeota archaeon]MBT4247275.1 hypothetical protein [Candidatus Woesearchaeota archaeon]MBT4433988.1 hypothetical protein [Candidatus Woesearchaeota archaeon]MBT7332385.1 hypothetical protein [Candidatus Woesearchaeota archaeon]
MNILYLDVDPLNGFVGEQMLDLEGHTATILQSKKELTPGIENDYDALILDAEAFGVPGDRSKTTISEYLSSITNYQGQIHVVTTQTQMSLRRDLGILVNRVSAHHKPFKWSNITDNLE